MRITRPEPNPRVKGSYDLYVNAIAYGKPYASIKLDDAGHLALDDINLADARRLAKAVEQVERELTAAHAQMKAPHGRANIYHGTCQLCGKPEDDELHAEPEPLKISDETIAAAKAVADDIEAGTWPPAPSGDGGVLFPAGDDEPKCRTKHSRERFVCTVPKGHEGPHQARGPQGELYASWNAEDAASVTA